MCHDYEQFPGENTRCMLERPRGHLTLSWSHLRPTPRNFPRYPTMKRKRVLAFTAHQTQTLKPQACLNARPKRDVARVDNEPWDSYIHEVLHQLQDKAGKCDLSRRRRRYLFGCLDIELSTTRAIEEEGDKTVAFGPPTLFE